MIRFLLFTLFLCLQMALIGQSITIKGIEKDPTNLEARIGEKVKIIDGENWAILKFRTMDKGFQVDAGATKPIVVYEIGEVWIYVKPKTRFLFIAHEKYGKSNTLNIIPPAESSTVYDLDVEMIAADGKNANVIYTAFCTVRVEPKDANVYINGELIVPIDGEVQKKLEYGKHDLRVESDMYHPFSQKIVVDETSKPIDVKLVPNFGWLNITTTPEQGANIMINDKLQNGKTPFKTDRVKSGEYTVTVSKDMYQSVTRKVVVNDNQVSDLSVDMPANFGVLNITTTPESGADILINGKRQSQKTPFKTERLPSGEYTVVVSKDMFSTVTKTIMLKDGRTEDVAIVMPANFGETKITANEGADIYIDGKRVGTTTWSDRLSDGVYTIEAKKDKHRADTRSVKVTKNVAQNIDFKLEPIVGSLDVVCVPAGSDIKLNGQSYGTTPTTINDLLIGDYEVVLSKVGFGTERRRITIEEGKTAEINARLSTGKDITINSSPADVKLYIDGNPVGTTPKTMPLSFGSHTVKLDNNGKKQVEETISVSETGKSSFDFNVNYSRDITFRSYPKSEVRINGDYKGYTPVTLSLNYANYGLTMSTKNNKIHRDSFWVGDGTDADYTHNFKTRPDYFITYGVSVPLADKFMVSSFMDLSFGVVVNHVGWYIRAKSSFDFGKTDLTYSDGAIVVPDGVTSLEVNDKSKLARFGVATGIVVKVAKPFYLSLGGGYGYANYMRGITQTVNGTTSNVWAKSLDNSFKGFEMDFNTLFKFGHFGLNAGVTTVGFKYCEVGLGVGVWF